MYKTHKDTVLQLTRASVDLGSTWQESYENLSPDRREARDDFLVWQLYRRAWSVALRYACMYASNVCVCMCSRDMRGFLVLSAVMQDGGRNVCSCMHVCLCLCIFLRQHWCVIKKLTCAFMQVCNHVVYVIQELFYTGNRKIQGFSEKTQKEKKKICILLLCKVWMPHVPTYMTKSRWTGSSLLFQACHVTKAVKQKEKNKRAWPITVKMWLWFGAKSKCQIHWRRAVFFDFSFFRRTKLQSTWGQYSCRTSAARENVLEHTFRITRSYNKTFDSAHDSTLSWRNMCNFWDQLILFFPWGCLPQMRMSFMEDSPLQGQNPPLSCYPWCCRKIPSARMNNKDTIFVRTLIYM